MIKLLPLLACCLPAQPLASLRWSPLDAPYANDQQRQTSPIITQVMEKFHYRKPTLDDVVGDL